jgi:hypothetical protein
MIPLSEYPCWWQYREVSIEFNDLTCTNYSNIWVQGKGNPVQALTVPGEGDSQISRRSAHEGGKVVSPTHRPPLPPQGKYSWYSFLLESWFDPRAILRSEGLCQWKIPVTPSGIESATFCPVAQAAVCSLQPGPYSSLTAPNLQPTANQHRNDQCGNQHHSRELMMMGI